MALTEEVEPSVGDTSPPEENDGRRDFSPNVRKLPQELMNIDESGEEIDVRSTHSARLFSPQQIKQAKEKHAPLYVRRQNLFPELSSLKPVPKEASKTKKEFKKATQVAKRHLFNREDRLRALSRINFQENNLPADIKKFLDDSKGRYPTLSL